MVYAVKVIPRAKRSEVVGQMEDGTLKVRIAAVPEDGKANEELCRVLREHFETDYVPVKAGHPSPRKLVEVEA